MSKHNDKIQVYLIGKKDDLTKNEFVKAFNQAVNSSPNVKIIDYTKSVNDNSPQKKHEDFFKGADYVIAFASNEWGNYPEDSWIFNEISVFYTQDKGQKMRDENRIVYSHLGNKRNDKHTLDIGKFKNLVKTHNRNDGFKEEQYKIFDEHLKAFENLDSFNPTYKENIENEVTRFLNAVTEKGHFEHGSKLKENELSTSQSELSEIMTGLDKLITFQKSDNALQAKYDNPNIRHFPVVDIDKKLLRIVSIRDIDDGVPTSAIKKEAAKMGAKAELIPTDKSTKTLGELGKEFSQNPNLFASIKEDGKHSEAIELLASKRIFIANGAEIHTYVGCLPVMDKGESLKGIITYIDLLKHSKKILGKDKSTGFWNTPISHFTDKLPIELIEGVRENDTLKTARNKMRTEELRTLIVFDGDSPTTRTAKGILTDLHLKKQYTEYTKILPVKIIMSPISSSFFKVLNTETVKDFIQKITKLDEDGETNSQKQEPIKAFTSFPVFDIEGESGKLVGIIGYTDILKKMYFDLTGTKL